jgi:serralysin
MPLNDRPNVCVARPQPQRLRADVENRRKVPWYTRPEDARAAAPLDSLWTPGQVIRVGFLRDRPAEGDAAIIERRIRAIAEEWTSHAHLTFRWVEGPASIRIAFEDTGSWSFIGTQCLERPPEEATMNFGWLSADLDEPSFRSVVLHEFGHALGMIHEHQNPSARIQWNRTAVYAYYARPPNQWPPAEVDSNVFATYDAALTQFSACDRGSIMMYPVPAAHLLEGDPVGWNTELSDADKAFIASLYPRPPAPAP